MLNNPLVAAVPVSVLLWAVGFSAGGMGSSSVVGARAEGRDAERVVVESLLAAFDEGLDLVSVVERREGPAGERRAVELGLGSVETGRVSCAGPAREAPDSGNRIVLVGLDPTGRVASVEVRFAPAGEAWQLYARKAELRASLRAGRVVHSLALEPAGGRGPRLVGAMRGGRRLLVDLGDFAPVEPPCAC
jgi:hypothetical protein